LSCRKIHVSYFYLYFNISKSWFLYANKTKKLMNTFVWNLNNSVNLFKIIVVCASFLCQTENFSNYPHICTDSLYCYDTDPVQESHTVIVLYYSIVLQILARCYHPRISKVLGWYQGAKTCNVSVSSIASVLNTKNWF